AGARGSEPGLREGWEITAEDVTGQRVLEDELRHLAATDALTGLANYRRFREVLDAEIRRSERTGRTFALLVFDLDGMKQINDRYGHLAGNRALCRVADVFRLSCRFIDTPVRYGGDEFAIVLPETGAREADLVGRRICDRLAMIANSLCFPRAWDSLPFPENGETSENLLHAA